MQAALLDPLIEIGHIAPRYHSLHVSVRNWAQSSHFTIDLYGDSVLCIVDLAGNNVASIHLSHSVPLQRCYAFFWLENTPMPQMIVRMREYLSCGKHAVLINDIGEYYICGVCRSRLSTEMKNCLLFCENCSEVRQKMKTVDRAARSWLLIGVHHNDLCADVVSYIARFVVRLATHVV